MDILWKQPHWDAAWLLQFLMCDRISSTDAWDWGATHSRRVQCYMVVDYLQCRDVGVLCCFGCYMR